MRTTTVAMLLAIAGLLAACTDSTFVGPPSPTVSSSLKAAAAHDTPREATIDEEFAALVQQAPGFGGMFVGKDGVLTIFLTDPSNTVARDVATRAWRTRWGRPGTPIIPGHAVRVRRATFDYAELMAAFRTIAQQLNQPRVTLLDIDERNNRILVGAVDEQARRGITTALQRLKLPEGAVTVAVFEPMVTYANLQSYFRPTLGGLQISFGSYLCTLGFNAYRKVNGVADVSHRYFVTNSHCTDVFGQMTGTVYGQPDNAHRVGVEAVDPPLFTSAQNSLCPVGRQCRNSDAVLVQYDTTVQWALGYIAGGDQGTTEFSDDLFYQNFITQEYRGSVMPIGTEKIGRTSGVSTGYVYSGNTCATVPQYETSGGYTYDTGRTMLCQAVASNMSTGPGDSGSPVYFQTDYPGLPVEDPNVTLLGILWGGNSSSAVYSPFSQIESELGPLYTLRQ